MVRIPSEYQEVEYLESTGTQYIDTDHVPTLNTKAHVVFSATVKNTIGFFGSRKDPYRFCCTTYSNGTTFGLNVCKNSWTSNKLSLNINTIYDCEFGNGFSKINGEEFLEPTLEEWDDTIRAFVLSGVDATGSRATTNAKYYLCDLWENDVIVRHLIPCYRKSDNEPGMYDTVSKTFFTNSGTGTFLVGNDINYSNTNLLEVRRRILLNTPHIESTSGNPAIFTTDMTRDLKECKIHFTPVQAGEGTPSPENVRLISGWDGVTVTRCGKCIYDGLSIATLASGGVPRTIYEDDHGRYVFIDTGNTYYPFPDWMIKENTRYTFILSTYASANVAFLRIQYSDGATEFISVNSETNTAAFVTKAGKTLRGINCIMRAATRKLYIDESGLFEGVLTTNDYEPYTETSITIPFPQTIFGGYVDLVKGEVVEEYVIREMDKFSTINKSSSSTPPWDHIFSIRNWVTGFGYDAGSPPDILCDCLERVNKTPNTNGTQNAGYIYDDTISTVEEFREKYSGHFVTYRIKNELQTTYSLTPQTIKALKGLNNLYSNANGDVEVKFWKH